MRRILALALLLTPPAFAALPRVALDAPLTPVVSAPAAFAGGAFPTATLASPALTPSLAAAPLPSALAAAAAVSAPSAPAAFAAAPAPAAAQAAPATSVDAVAPAATPASPASPLRGASAASFSAASVGDAPPDAAALARRFDGAAAHDATAPGPGAAVPASAASSDALLERLLSRVTIDDGGVPETSRVLRRAFARMLESPTARVLAERYVAEGAPATVRFADVGETQLTAADGRPYFQGTRALTDWTGAEVVVRLNPAYLVSDAHHLEQGLPTILAHELLGHGLWYARAARENMYQAFHHHELNETNARLVGWLVDFELDRRFEEAGAWDYLQNPQGYLDGLKLRLPYYALTFSNAELLRPVEALEARLAAARATRARLETERDNQRTWTPVIDHFVSRRGVAPERFRLLRQQFATSDAVYGDAIAVVDSLIAEVDAVIGRFKAETDKTSERYLAGAAVHPLFAELQRESDENLRVLLEQVRASGARAADADPDAQRRHAEHWRGQIDFKELERMYLKDRKEHPKHWL